MNEDKTRSSTLDNPEFLAILDARSFPAFAAQYGESLDRDLCKWIRGIIAAGPSELGFTRLHILAWYIFAERQGVAFGKPASFPVSAKAARFQEYIYRLGVFSSMDIPYREWESMVACLFPTLERMAESGKLKFRSQECREVEKHSAEVLRRVTQDPQYDQLYTDYLNGAL